MPYPEKLENLLSLKEAAEIWNMSPATIQTALYQHRFHEYARKIGKSWIILPEGMIEWRGRPIQDETPSYPKGIESTLNDFVSIRMAVRAWKKGDISADEALKMIDASVKRLIT